MTDQTPMQHPKDPSARSDAPVTEVPLPNGDILRIDGQGRILCDAKRRDGEICKAPTIAGLKKCRMHSGQNKNARVATQLALAKAVNPALATLITLVSRAENESVRLRAADSVLDRAGFGRMQTIEAADAKELLYQRLLVEVEEQENEYESGE